MTEQVARVVVRKVIDQDPDLSWLEQDCFNEPTATEEEGWGRRRLTSYGEDWVMVGMVATAKCKHGGTIDATSLWGIEDDSGDDYFASVALDLLDELRAPVDVPNKACNRPGLVFPDDVVEFIDG
jgi:hypothetical protein